MDQYCIMFPTDDECGGEGYDGFHDDHADDMDDMDHADYDDYYYDYWLAKRSKNKKTAGELAKHNKAKLAFAKKKNSNAAKKG